MRIKEHCPDPGPVFWAEFAKIFWAGAAMVGAALLLLGASVWMFLHPDRDLFLGAIGTLLLAAFIGLPGLLIVVMGSLVFVVTVVLEPSIDRIVAAIRAGHPAPPEEPTDDADDDFPDDDEDDELIASP